MENNCNLNNEDNDLIEKNGEGENIEDVDIRSFKFKPYGADLMVRQYVDMLKENEIEIPKMQRNYVWNIKTASRFIESILLDLPIPSIFLAKVLNNKFVIVDGLQRLTTLKKYINNEIKICNSKDIRPEWRGKRFDELNDYDKRTIRNKTIHSIIVEQQQETNNGNGLFLIFERINTGGMFLNQQEIRNAIFQYPINQLINDQLNSNSNWRKMFGSDQPHSRMRDSEMILRFLSLSEIDFKKEGKGSINMIRLLNDFLTKNKNATKESLDAYSQKFLDTITAVKKCFGENIFHLNMQNFKKSRKFYAIEYDAIMLSTLHAIKHKVNFENIAPSMELKLKKLFDDEMFKNACSAHTNEYTSIRTRISRASEILFDLKYEN